MAEPVDKLGDRTEDQLLTTLAPHFQPHENLLVGPGDDCAVIQSETGELTLLKVDALVEGKHYETGTPPGLVGRKALARPMSDMAAMGGFPQMALVTLACGPDRAVSEVDAIYAGLSSLASKWGTVIAGGETVALATESPLLLSITLTGGLPKNGKPVLRSGGCAGDLLAVTGRLGNSFASGRHLEFTPRITEGRRLAEFASAMMDLSDGLASDLPRMAAASGCGFQIEAERLPCHSGASPEQAARDGEDYELLVAVPEDRWEELEKSWAKEDIPLTQIGCLTESDVDAPDWFQQGGWDHFSS